MEDGNEQILDPWFHQILKQATKKKGGVGEVKKNCKTTHKETLNVGKNFQDSP